MEKTRDYLFDNVRGVLIFAMVLGHFLQIRLRDGYPFFEWMWVCIYSFHIPAFLCISGYFSKDYTVGNARKVHRMAICYLLGWMILYLSQYLVYGSAAIRNPLIPPFAMWYLLSLFLMRLLLPWLACIRFVGIISVAAALLAGGMQKIGSFLALSRTISFLPFFLAGALLADREKITSMRRQSHWAKILFFLGWAAALACFLYLMQKNDMNYEIVWAKKNYQAAGMSLGAGILARSSFFLTAAFSVVLLLLILPEKRCFLSRWGRNSLSVYLLHITFFYVLKRWVDGHGLPAENPGVLTAFLLVLTAAVVRFLSGDIVNRFVCGLIQGIDRITRKGVSS